MRLTKLLSVFAIAATSSVLAPAAMAQTEPLGFEPVRIETIPEAFERAFFSESGTFYQNRTLPRQAAYIIGPGLPGRAAFPELELERDAERVDSLYRELIDQQASADPLLRTPDLPNPFDSSIRLSSVSNRFGSRVEGGEFVFETVPPR
ncbi:MAG TPA: hypothetical protein V6D14_13820 [Coleofasciculaceae cyanobacterium]|jgi:hypothetical protein